MDIDILPQIEDISTNCATKSGEKSEDLLIVETFSHNLLRGTVEGQRTSKVGKK